MSGRSGLPAGVIRSTPVTRSDRYPIPAAACEHEIEERRSRFRASLAGAASVDEAKAFIATVRERYPDATHHCWAFLVGPPGSSDRVGMSDDGEPHGTAGRPMLQVLTHAPLGDVVVVVTRWYGGVKLGTGGLARAYSDAVQQVIAVAPTAERIEWCEVGVEIDYAGVEPLRRLLPAHEATITDEAWGERATFTVRLPQEGREGFVAQVVDASNGTAVITGG
jgi:uncharacterized YigZ family protein